MTGRTLLRFVGAGCALALLSMAAAPAAASDRASEARLDALFEELRRGEPDILVASGAHGMTPARRCGTPSGDPVWRAAMEESARLWRELFPDIQERPRTIPVAFHVLYKGGGVGNLTDAEVEAQIDVLNDAYDAANFTFVLSSLDRTKKKKWFKKCHKFGPFSGMTDALAIDPAHNVNVYTCKPGGNLLGFAFLPGTFDQADPFNAMVLHYQTLPGGAFLLYDEGDTGTHEMGHYLGLYHTFTPWDIPGFGDGCIPPGDLVGDTPYEQRPDYICEEGRNTCPQSGTDPVHNFMDYGPDACINKFTAKQRKRMNEQLDMFRPDLS